MFCAGATLQAQQLKETSTFPLNEYLTTMPGLPYPAVNNSKVSSIDISKFVNVMDYGAKGDGKTYDDNAIAQAIKAAQYGVIFPAGRTFLVSKITKITLTRDLTVYAYGATIKMADQCRYSFLSLRYQSGSYHNKVIWLGGTLDGNQYNQTWPGNPHGGKYNGAFVETHGRFLGVSFAEFVLFKDLTVLNTVVDGPTAESCKLAVFASSKASGGAPIAYEKVQEQGTYFKSTREGMKTTYFLDLNCQGGSIGTHLSYPTRSAMDNSILSVHVNCKYNNQAQDAIHVEDCFENFFYNCAISADGGDQYKERLHLSNRSGVVSVQNCQFTNSYLNFNQASSLRLGMVNGCTFVNTGVSLRTFVDGNPHLVTNNTFTGKCGQEQSDGKNVRNCTFSNFGSLALSGATATDNSTFINGTTAVSTGKSGFVVNCSFQQVKNTSYKTTPSSSNWQQVFTSYIDVYSDGGKYLGRIDCGSAATIKLLNASSEAVAMPAMNALTSQPQQVSVYPNPTSDVLRVTLNETVSGKTSLTIVDAQGRFVQTRSVNKTNPVTTETMNVSALPAGTYILQILGTNQKTALKFVVTR